MLEETTRQNLLIALESLKNDLRNKSEKIKELETIRAECEWIQSIIRQIEERLDPGASLPEIDFSAPLRGQGLGLIEPEVIEKPIIDGVDEIFNELNRSSMPLKDIVIEFRKKRWKLSQDNPQESIRSALKKHPNRYRKISRGIWQKIRQPKPIPPRTLPPPKPTPELLHDEKKEGLI